MRKKLIMNFQKNELLSTEELYKRLGITKDYWKKNRKEILIELSNIYEYEVIYEGRKIIYKFNNKIGNYLCSADKRDKAFEDAILEILQEQPLNTAANVARIIIKEWHEVTDLGYTEGTIYEYTRVRMRKWFGVSIEDKGSFEDMEDMNMRKGYINKKVWCMADINDNVYEPMSQEQINEFIEIVKSNLKLIEEKEISLLADFDAGLITKEEYKEAAGFIKFERYTVAKAEFSKKYGFYPIKVPEYVLYERK